MSGVQKSNSYVDDKLAGVLSKIESQLLRYKQYSEVNDAICMDENTLIKMTPEELVVTEFRLKKFALSVKLDLNKCVAVKMWLERCMNTLIAKYYKDIDSYMERNIKRETVAAIDSYGARISELLMEYNLEIETINGVSEMIDSMSYTISKLGKVK